MREFFLKFQFDLKAFLIYDFTYSELCYHVFQQMIAAEAPVLFSKACEMFILELTLRSWIHTEENKRRTLQRNDIAGAITRGDIFDFLVDIVPRDELKVLLRNHQIVNNKCAVY